MSNHLDHIYEARKASFDQTGEYLPDSEILMGPTNPHKLATNNGGATDYYAVPPSATTLQDLIEFKHMNFAQGNIFKAIYRLNDTHHSDTIRDLNKIIWFAQRELSRLNKDPQ